MDILKKNQIYTVRIDGYTSDSAGVCHIEGRAVFVPGAIPGELWEIRILKVSAGAVYAKGERLIESVPARTKPLCPYFACCGGCDTWHMSYEEELRFKLMRVNDALHRIGGQSVDAHEIIGSDSVTGYRNKGIFAVSGDAGHVVAGFYKERSHQLVAVDHCLIQNELSSRVAGAVIDFMNSHGIAAYDEESGRGYVRHVFCRKAVNTQDAVVCVVAARGFGGHTAAFVDTLRTACPELSGIVLNINKTRGNTILTGAFHTLWGRPDITDTLCGLSFDIAPQAFLQVNPPQAERLYQRAIEYARPAGVALALDLYCGAGTISLCLAKQAAHVIGAEIVPEAVQNAAQNAERNNIANVEFICADAGETAAALTERGLKPELVVLDPPRKGMAESAVAAVASISPERIVYVSCDPATLSRDILRFQGFGYALDKVTAVDMFPRTCHVECVVLMSRVEK